MATRMRVTLKRGSPLLTGDLYQLESALGCECSGHGIGFSGEDIHFPFPDDATKELSINRSGRVLTVSATRFSRDTCSDADLSEITSPMHERFVELLRAHAEEPIPDELV